MKRCTVVRNQRGELTNRAALLDTLDTVELVLIDCRHSWSYGWAVRKERRGCILGFGVAFGDSGLHLGLHPANATS